MHPATEQMIVLILQTIDLGQQTSRDHRRYIPNAMYIFLKICLTRGDTQLVLPLVYDMQMNVTQLADKQNAQPHLIAVSLHLKR